MNLPLCFALLAITLLPTLHASPLPSVQVLVEGQVNNVRVGHVPRGKGQASTVPAIVASDPPVDRSVLTGAPQAGLTLPPLPTAKSRALLYDDEPYLDYDIANTDQWVPDGERHERSQPRPEDPSLWNLRFQSFWRLPTTPAKAPARVSTAPVAMKRSVYPSSEDDPNSSGDDSSDGEESDTAADE